MTTYGSVSEWFVLFPNSKITSGDINLSYHPLASNWVGSVLAPKFIVPFSTNNITSQLLTYHKIQHLILLRTRDPADSAEIGDSLDAWIESLVEGKSAMVTSDGAAIFAQDQFSAPEEQVSSNNETFTPVFAMDDSLLQHVDPNLLDEIESDRDGT